MKRVIETEESGLEAMLGTNTCLFCGIYIYTGKLVGINTDHIEIENAKIVYEVGALASGEWEVAEKLPGIWRIMLASIESWGTAKCE